MTKADWWRNIIRYGIDGAFHDESLTYEERKTLMKHVEELCVRSREVLDANAATEYWEGWNNPPGGMKS